MYNPMGMPNNMQRPGNNVFSQPQYPAPPQPAPYQSYQPYQSSYASRLQQMEQQMGQSTSTVPQMAWVNGIEGAKAYVLPPNTKIMLMDSDAPKFYIKESDMNGQPSFKAYRFEEDIQQIPQNNYVNPDVMNNMQQTINGLQQELAQCQAKIEELTNRINENSNVNITPVVPKVTTKKESASNGKSAE